MNVHASRSFGKLLLAAEYTELVLHKVIRRDAYLVLADYDYNDKIGVLFVSANRRAEIRNDYEKITIAPNYSITDNLGAILEFSDVEIIVADSNELLLS